MARTAVAARPPPTEPFPDDSPEPLAERVVKQEVCGGDEGENQITELVEEHAALTTVALAAR